MKNLLDYAAKPSNNYIGYGSIDNGITVLQYRTIRKKHWINQGFSIEDAYVMACKDVTMKFGNPL